jgi:hypothetical protein
VEVRVVSLTDRRPVSQWFPQSNSLSGPREDFRSPASNNRLHRPETLPPTSKGEERARFRRYPG